MQSDLNGRTALITGGGRGIGSAAAERLATAGVANVVLVARTSGELEKAASRVRAAGANTRILPVDLGTGAAVDIVAATALDAFGGVDILISAAATVAPLGATASLDSRSVTAALGLNVAAPILLSGVFARGMVERGWGRIVNVSSGVAAHPASMVGGGVYAASKAALEAHTLSLAAELEGSGVTANVYRPGTVDTAMQQWIRDQDPEKIGHALHDRFVGMHESGRLISPEESAAALVDRLLSRPEDTGAVWDVADRPAAS